MKKVISILLLTALIASCTKHKGDIEDAAPVASLMFLNPSINKTYRSGDSVNINALAISSASIHGYDLIIKKQNDTTTCYFLHVHEHNDTININKSWVNNMSGAHKMDAFIKLYLDHDGHVLTGKASFTIE
jgi:hypothetical protein